MCGIVGVVGDVDARKFLIDGLYSLDYRGYDSAGVSFLDEESHFLTFKKVGRVELLDKSMPKSVPASLGIGHTRWATHGAPTLENCHPQFSTHHEFAIAHNGVIENYRFLKSKLIANGYTFESDTDTEVVANLLEYNTRKNGDPLDGIRRTIEELDGSFALAIIYSKTPGKLYFAKRSSPLFIGVSDNANFLGSDAVPMIKYTNKFVDLDDEQYGVLAKDSFEVYSGYKKLNPEISTQNPELLNRDLGDNPNFMIKEIKETPQVIQRLIDNYYDGQDFLFDKRMLDSIRKADDIVFIACGTSYHASRVGQKYMEFIGKRSEAYVASEWAYFPVFTSKKPLYILVSQSGETADLIRCQKIINSRGLTNIAITNSKGSTIERNATYSLLLFAGLEVAVASTKAFSAQVAMMALVIGALQKQNNVINHLGDVIKSIVDIFRSEKVIEQISSELDEASIVFYVGRGGDYNAAMEGALKMKEITYIHCDAFPGGELKHGPIALVDGYTKLVAFNSDVSTDLAIRNNVKEIESRGAKSYIFSLGDLFKDGDALKVKEVKGYLSVIPMVVVSQLLAYYVAYHRGVNIDKPRNLAKSVTVE